MRIPMALLRLRYQLEPFSLDHIVCLAIKIFVWVAEKHTDPFECYADTWMIDRSDIRWFRKHQLFWDVCPVHAVKTRINLLNEMTCSNTFLSVTIHTRIYHCNLNISIILACTHHGQRLKSLTTYPSILSCLPCSNEFIFSEMGARSWSVAKWTPFFDAVGLYTVRARGCISHRAEFPNITLIREWCEFFRLLP